MHNSNNLHACPGETNDFPSLSPPVLIEAIFLPVASPEERPSGCERTITWNGNRTGIHPAHEPTHNRWLHAMNACLRTGRIWTNFKKNVMTAKGISGRSRECDTPQPSAHPTVVDNGPVSGSKAEWVIWGPNCTVGVVKGGARRGHWMREISLVAVGDTVSNAKDCKLHAKASPGTVLTH